MKTYSLAGVTTALLAISPLLSTSAHAHGDYDGYVTDSAGQLVRDSSGDCIIHGFWRKELAVAECHPELMPQEEEEEAAAPPPPPEPAPMPKIQTVTLEATPLFDFDKATLKPSAEETLQGLVQRIRKVKEVERVHIVGHTDSTGPEAYNQKLSVRRAMSVKNYLLDKGIDPRLVSTAGEGESKPVASNDTREGRARNRRVEITIEAKDTAN